ncbi:MAG: hypothetical protein ACE5EX_01325 [Phycisphaerae bacterium]
MMRKAGVAVLAVGAIAAGALWTASMLCDLDVSVIGDHRAIRARCFFGQADITFLRDEARNNPRLGVRNRTLLAMAMMMSSDSLEYRLTRQTATFFVRRRHERFASYVIVGFPLWLPFTLFMAYPTIVFVGGRLGRRRRRRERGLCVRCTYNLTGNTSGICPECGTAIEPPNTGGQAASDTHR